MTSAEELEYLLFLREELIEEMQHFVCEWHEQACYEKLKNLTARIKALESEINND